MSFIDHFASIPYRIFGIFLILISILLSIPVFVVPTLLVMVIDRQIFKSEYNITKRVIDELTFEELLIKLKSINWFTYAGGFFIEKICKGLCMVLGGIYYYEAWEYLLRIK